MYAVDTIKPYGPNVLVKRFPPKLETDSGIALPETDVEKNLECRVLSVGDGEYINGTFVHSNLKEGQTVIIRQFDGRSLNLSKELLLVHHELIEAIVKYEDVPQGE